MPSSDHITLTSKIVQSTEVIGTDIEDGHLMVSIENGKYYGVTAVGERIWELSSQPISLSDLCDKLMEEYDVDRAQCEADVLEFVTDMYRNKIISVVN